MLDDHDGRYIAFEAIHNFRDIGGYAAGEGRRIRRGLVYRSASPHQASAADRERLRTLGIRHIFDLRSEPEAAEQGQADFSDIGAVVHHIPVFRDLDTSPLAIAARARMYGTDFADAYMHMLERGGPTFRAVLQSISEAEGPAVVHCAGGKDRAGNAIMLLLSILGVDHDTIVADYALTTRYLPPPDIQQLTAYSQRSGISVEDLVSRHGAQAEAMERTLARVQAEFGGPIAYLRGLGMDEETMERLRQQLLA
jgi:protein-tyrosine phosphatase